MTVILQLLDPLLEEVVGIVQIERDAGAEHVNDGETLVPDALLEEV